MRCSQSKAIEQHMDFLEAAISFYTYVTMEEWVDVVSSSFNQNCLHLRQLNLEVRNASLCPYHYTKG